MGACCRTSSANRFDFSANSSSNDSAKMGPRNVKMHTEKRKPGWDKIIYKVHKPSAKYFYKFTNLNAMSFISLFQLKEFNILDDIESENYFKVFKC